MLNAQQIATLRASLLEANTSLANLKTQFEAQGTQIANLTDQLATANGENAALKATNAELSEKIVKLEGNIAGKVVEGIAAAGVPPVARVPEASGSGKPDAEPKQGDGLTGLSKVEALIAAQIGGK